MDEIGKLLPTLLKKEMRRPEPRILEVLVPLWPRIAGKAMAQHTRPASFELGTLTLHTNCPTWALQLRQMSEEIRSKVNSVLGRETVKEAARQGRGTSWRARRTMIEKAGTLDPARIGSRRSAKYP